MFVDLCHDSCESPGQPFIRAILRVFPRLAASLGRARELCGGARYWAPGGAVPVTAATAGQVRFRAGTNGRKRTFWPEVLAAQSVAEVRFPNPPGGGFQV
jgi:hypothetical protein